LGTILAKITVQGGFTPAPWRQVKSRGENASPVRLDRIRIDSISSKPGSDLK
jgi:hypothetical protein